MYESISYLQMDKKRHPEKYLTDEQSDAVFGKLLKDGDFLVSVAREPDPEVSERMCFEKLDELVAAGRKSPVKSKVGGWFND